MDLKNDEKTEKIAKKKFLILNFSSTWNQWISLKFHMIIANYLKLKLGIYKNCVGGLQVHEI